VLNWHLKEVNWKKYFLQQGSIQLSAVTWYPVLWSFCKWKFSES